MLIQTQIQIQQMQIQIHVLHGRQALSQTAEKSKILCSGGDDEDPCREDTFTLSLSHFHTHTFTFTLSGGDDEDPCREDKVPGQPRVQQADGDEPTPAHAALFQVVRCIDFKL